MSASLIIRSHKLHDPMKLMKPYILSILILFSQLVLADAREIDGETLFKTYCSSCHGLSGGMDMNKRVAPPIAAVRLHYIGKYQDKVPFVEAVANWVEHQDADKSMMRGAIRRFNIMPPISIARKDAEKIAAYIYQGDIEKPAGFEKHVKEEHGR